MIIRNNMALDRVWIIHCPRSQQQIGLLTFTVWWGWNKTFHRDAKLAWRELRKVERSRDFIHDSRSVFLCGRHALLIPHWDFGDCLICRHLLTKCWRVTRGAGKREKCIWTFLCILLFAIFICVLGSIASRKADETFSLFFFNKTWF